MGCNQTTQNDISEAENRPRVQPNSQQFRPSQPTSPSHAPPLKPRSPMKDPSEMGMSQSIGVVQRKIEETKILDNQVESFTNQRERDNEVFLQDLLLKQEREIQQIAEQNMFDLSQMEDPLNDEEMEERHNYYLQFTCGSDKGLSKALPKSLSRDQPKVASSPQDQTLIQSHAQSMIKALNDMHVIDHGPIITTFTTIDNSQLEEK